MKGLSTGFI